MAQSFSTLADLYGHGFDTVIDVRSPSEFAEDHVPGAISLPVLSDDERARVGTIYVQESAFLARKIGAALVARNAAAHIETRLMEKGGGWRPLVYCWRGGQRSGSFGSILAQIGWRTDTIEGGYQRYRRLVSERLYDRPLGLRVVLLDGNTGTAKTDLLQRLGARGVQVVDLEGLAHHRGSLLGAMAGGQPSQKAFESALALALSTVSSDRPLVLEAESSKIGDLIVPPQLWALMKKAPRITVEAPLEARAAYLTEAYADMIEDPEELKERILPLRTYQGKAIVKRWMGWIDEGAFRRFASELMYQHYDPAYAKSRAQRGGGSLGVVTAATLDMAGREAAADQIAALLD
ncbi:tRNA 2-selenouridine(34) synthase MnmH [Aestuariibius insulae]|uniref:tRNA 2-selenouridine(34) synthase MnmH n=1 Tax=Aestuariibius insulae TaxID=2058287 RepID=UPI00345E9E86